MFWMKLALKSRLKIVALVIVGAAPLWLAAQTLSVKDDAGTIITLKQPAKAVITLAPNLTELAFAAGAGHAVQAVGRYSDFPAQAKTLPVVSDAYVLNLEAIAHAKPDLIFVWLSGTPQRQRDALKKLGIPVFESEIHDIEGIASTLERMGTLMGTSTTAQSAAKAFVSDWKQLQASRTEKLQREGGQRLRVFYQVWDKPLMTFNGQHLVSLAIRTCGGAQGFDSLTALTPTVSREAVLAFNPQLILSGDEKGLPMWQAFAQLAATAKGQLKKANAELLTRMGPRFVSAARELCGQIDAAQAVSQRP
jgi:iron complex transport system substrate-binding protein